MKPWQPETAAAPEQLQQLQHENLMLRHQLDELLDQAYRNQEIMQRHQRFDLLAIAAHRFEELIHHVFDELARISDLDAVTLVLLDPLGEIQQMAQDLRMQLSDYPKLWFVRQAQEVLPVAINQAMLGPYQSSYHSQLFASCARKPNSVAILPLLRQHRLLGYLNLGCYDIRRFQENMATDFIERLASILAICLENVINSEKLTHIGLTDTLTRVSNRRHVELRALEEVERARRQHYDIACLYLDLDHFKQINDRYGHQCGDEVLIEVARRIKAELRLSDTLGRFGGEEFVAVLVNADFQSALQVAERIRKNIAATAIALSDGLHCPVTISIGLACLNTTDNQGNVSELMRRLLQNADRALYAAKHNGRNQVRCF